jgi:hypothetical protein
MERRQLVTRWQDQDTTKYQYQNGQGRVGGQAVKATGAVDPQLRIGTLNVNGLDDTKLELILQFVQGETIDVLFLIDTRIEKKAGKYMGKKIKRRLGAGTRTHVTPCTKDYGSSQLNGFRRVGGIITIIGPRWGNSVREFQDDKFGPDKQTVGVMTQVTMSTTNGDINAIGTYWPNKHRP